MGDTRKLSTKSPKQSTKKKKKKENKPQDLLECNVHVLAISISDRVSRYSGEKTRWERAMNLHSYKSCARTNMCHEAGRKECLCKRSVLLHSTLCSILSVTDWLEGVGRNPTTIQRLEKKLGGKTQAQTKHLIKDKLNLKCMSCAADLQLPLQPC